MCLVCAGGLLTEVVGLHGKMIAPKVISFMGVQKKPPRTPAQGECINAHRYRGSALFERLNQVQGHSSQPELLLSSKIRTELWTVTVTL